MSDPHLLLVGKLPRGLSAADVAGCTRVDSIDEACDRLTSLDVPPALIVLIQEWPGQIAADSVEALRRRAPLARFERLMGTWCEGEQRSDRPPTGCTSGYWHQWQPRLRAQLARATAGFCPAWGQPPTVSADERLLAAAAEPPASGTGQIVVCCASRETGESLADVCRLGGYTATIEWNDRAWSSAGASAVVWDATVDEMISPRRVEEVRGASGGAPIIAVVGFPRVEDVQQARECGVTAVVAKPFVIHDLLWHLSEATARTTK